MPEMDRTVALHTLGCKVNQYDSSSVAALFQSRGYRVVPFDEPADIYIVNTCTVTGIGDHKSRQMLRKARRNNPQAVVVAMGCYAQTAPEELMSMPEVDMVVGTSDREDIVDKIEAFGKSIHDADSPEPKGLLVRPVDEYTGFEDLPAHVAEGRTRAIIKIQDGCDQFCAYCKIPYARGRVRSRRPQSVIDQVARVVEDGYLEIVLTGIHLGAYGKDLGPEQDLAAIVADVAESEPGVRIRLGSVDSTEVTDRLISVMADHGNICRHLHVPLQSGDDAVLRRMRRRYTVSEYEDRIGALRERIPGCAVTTDVIVGFPGETDEEFEDTLQTIRRVSFSRLHVFRYSRRRGTPAADMPGQIASSVKEDRSARLIELGANLSLLFHEQMVGQTFLVLVEGEDELPGRMYGLTDTYVRVSFDGPPSLAGRLVPIKIESAKAEGAFGVQSGAPLPALPSVGKRRGVTQTGAEAAPIDAQIAHSDAQNEGDFRDI